MEIAAISFTAQGAHLARTIKEQMERGRGGEEMCVSLYTASDRAAHLARRIEEPLGTWTGRMFARVDALVFVGACGVAVRSIAPFVADKRTDPAVLAVDDRGEHVIPLLSGHLGGANALAVRIAGAVGGVPVVTTASDQNRKLPIDLWAKENGLALTDMAMAKELAAAYLDGERIGFRSDLPVAGELPDGFVAWGEEAGSVAARCGRAVFADGHCGGVSDRAHAAAVADSDTLRERQTPRSAVRYGVYVGCDRDAARTYAHTLWLVPRRFVAGIGCRRGKTTDELLVALRTALRRSGYPAAALAGLASIDRKRDEEGLIGLAQKLREERNNRHNKFFCDFYSAEELKCTSGTTTSSEFVEAVTGVDNVCERAALLAAARHFGGEKRLVLEKQAADGITVALAVAPGSVRFPAKSADAAAGAAADTTTIADAAANEARAADTIADMAKSADAAGAAAAGRVCVVGVGPGNYGQMTEEAIRTLRDADVIVGYTLYVELLRRYFPEAEVLTTPMRQEEKRCRLCFEEARKGRTVAMVCSGDAGVYGMAGLVCEIGAAYPDIPVTVTPGVTAALSGGAVLGAPLGHDFAVISLSDLLTPWELIERRLRAAAEADFCICLYNPGSKRRKGHLCRAVKILLETKPADTACGYVRNIGREGESRMLCTLGELMEQPADMFTTVFIGSSTTRVIAGKLVTPRGYRYEKDFDFFRN